jgi:hypothetical protein
MVRSFCALQRRSSALLLVRGCFGVMGITSYSPSCANPVLNTSSRTRYGRIISFLNSRVSEQNWQFRAYIPTVGVSLMPRDMPMKWIFWHLSHIMPMWIGMAQITAWTAFFLCRVAGPSSARIVLCFRPPFVRQRADSVSNAAFPKLQRWRALRVCCCLLASLRTNLLRKTRRLSLRFSYCGFWSGSGVGSGPPIPGPRDPIMPVPIDSICFCIRSI